MDTEDDDRPVADRQRGSSNRDCGPRPSKAWFCNPLVLRAIIAIARFIYVLVLFFLRR